MQNTNEIKVWIHFDTEDSSPEVQFLGKGNIFRKYQKVAIFIEIMGWVDTGDIARNFKISWESANQHVKKLEDLGYIKTEYINLDGYNGKGSTTRKMIHINESKRFFKEGEQV